MKPVLSRAQMRAFDRAAIEACKVPGIVLMENAGRGAADEIERTVSVGPAGRVVVVAGPGNNGGDGFVVARHLLLRGFAVEVAVLAPRERFGGDALVQYEAFLGVGGAVVEAPDPPSLPALEAALDRAGVIVDAIFGTGLDRPVAEHHARAIEAINRRGPGSRAATAAATPGSSRAATAAATPGSSRAQTLAEFAPERQPLVVALDIPSGLDADAGVPLGAAVRADVTVTFAHHKLGLLSSTAAAYTGRIQVADIGVPASLVGRVGRAASLVEDRDAASLLVSRPPNAHKNSAGNVLVIAGSPGKVGAALLVGRGALRAGAGLVTLATWPDVAHALETRVVELMTARIDPARIADSIDGLLHGRHAIAIGSGLGLDTQARALVEHVLARWGGPKVVDADALTIFAGRPEAIAARVGEVVLTPHPGEAARLLGCGADEVERNRFAAARDLATRAASVVVLKGAHTIVADGTRARGGAGGPAEVELAIMPAADAALATAGSGDVLSGITAAFLAALPPFEAAIAAVQVHALAGAQWRSRTRADRGLLAGEIADEVPRVLGALGIAELSV